MLHDISPFVLDKSTTTCIARYRNLTCYDFEIATIIYQDVIKPTMFLYNY